MSDEIKVKPPDWFATPMWQYGSQLGRMMEQGYSPTRPPGQPVSPLIAEGIQRYGTSPGGLARSMFGAMRQPGMMQPSYEQQALAAMGNVQPYQQAQGYFGDVAGGQYLGLNPELQRAVMDPAISNVASRFAAAGRYGSPASQTSMAEAGMRAMMPFYDQERTRQGQANLMLPQLQQGMAGQLQQAGAYNPQLDYMSRIAPLVSTGMAGGMRVQQPGGGGGGWKSTLGGAAGGAMSGAKIGTMLGGPGIGTAAGAVGGALLGGLIS